MYARNTFLSALCAIAIAGVADTALAQDIPAKKRTRAGLYLTSVEAAKLVQMDEVLFVDVRTRAEITFVGIPTRANVNIPFMVMPAFPEFDEGENSYRLELNGNFAGAFLEYVQENGFHADSPIVLICRSGSRSAKAANILTDLGFSRVYSVVDGFEGEKAKNGPMQGQRVINGWRNSGLEWSYKIGETQVYPEDAG